MSEKTQSPLRGKRVFFRVVPKYISQFEAKAAEFKADVLWNDEDRAQVVFPSDDDLLKRFKEDVSTFAEPLVEHQAVNFSKIVDDILSGRNVNESIKGATREIYEGTPKFTSSEELAKYLSGKDSSVIILFDKGEYFIIDETKENLDEAEGHDNSEFKYYAQYTAGNPTWGGNAEELLNSLGGKKVYGRVVLSPEEDKPDKVKFIHGNHWYLFPDMETYNKFIDALKDKNLDGLITVYKPREYYKMYY